MTSIAGIKSTNRIDSFPMFSPRAARISSEHFSVCEHLYPGLRSRTGTRPDQQNFGSIYTYGVIPQIGNLDWRSLLARPRLPSPSLEVLDALYGQSILVTGAGGTVGSALALRVGNLAPSSLLLLDTSESRLYDLQQSWSAEGIPGTMTPILGSVSNRTLLDELFTAHAPRIVFHTAAFKHVALMEEQPLAAIANNVFGTQTLTRAASTAGARVVLLSTDKAVEPTSVMGATKRLSERIVLAAGGTVLRTGNVLGSRDSVTETFARQIAQRRPLTVRDPAARRYFLTLDESVNLLLMAAAEAAPALLAPEISAPTYITDLAHFMAQSLAPGSAFEIDFTSPRPGEKDPDHFWSAAECPRPAAQAGLLSLQCAAVDSAMLEPSLTALRVAEDTRDLSAALTHLCELVPEYTPSPAVLAVCKHRVSS
jgi:FlaA1/EpsC-like NDP-sugar epimerase